ncbi:Os09g0261400 [Oryza sativa Japonica Group]|uniref:Os09g0261400 protein n=4 Tax=Oryza TaxID=4527 RepID=B9G220_ORYSJ|nr:hypothetical protein OsI_30605 [Oryza sativa Indica Group]EEE69301.1 hypothetical protein OsJ_28582 [Oryza sativa Japonica Group]KAB8109881.1 hypothetical protein EE612_046437 [Oryza sativa]BAD29555.1 unknown protein [Oryza sativa Japonica Group]BAD38248.1 unknown protein [Oryza sativa Japonica Group]|eukprot:NP_001062709.1 Os09g0261400 [Oryza sativa Japonica Group]
MAAARVSIPAAVRRTIQNIKEIAGGHTDEEVYAVLRECNMDPNETTDRLLNQVALYGWWFHCRRSGFYRMDASTFATWNF